MVHNAARSCATQAGGAQCSPVPKKWSQRRSHKPRRTDGRAQSDAYDEPTVRVAQVA